MKALRKIRSTPTEAPRERGNHCSARKADRSSSRRWAGHPRPRHPRGRQPGPAARRPRRVRRRRAARRRCAGRAPAGRSASCTGSACSPAPSRRRSGAGSPTSTRRCCAPTTGTATAIDEVEFHPAWHELMTRRGRPRPARRAVGVGPAGRARGPGRQVLRLVPGRGGPRLPDLDDLRRRARAAAHPRARRRSASRCSPRAPTTSGCAPPPTKRGLIAGMAMTEKQGGSDVRANTTARRAARRRHVRAHRPQVVHLRADVRRVPRARAGARRPVLLPAAAGAARRHPQRDAAACGSRTSSATGRTPRPRWSTSGAIAWLVGEEGRGVRTIIEMVNMTRLDCVIGSAAPACARALVAGASTTPRTAARSAARWSTSR